MQNNGGRQAVGGLKQEFVPSLLTGDEEVRREEVGAGDGEDLEEAGIVCGQKTHDAQRRRRNLGISAGRGLEEVDGLVEALFAGEIEGDSCSGIGEVGIVADQLHGGVEVGGSEDIHGNDAIEPLRPTAIEQLNGLERLGRILKGGGVVAPGVEGGGDGEKDVGADGGIGLAEVVGDATEFGEDRRFRGRLFEGRRLRGGERREEEPSAKEAHGKIIGAVRASVPRRFRSSG